ncbi:MAG: glycosyltransferase family 2 protein [Alphaproteobacteria bacterium]
MSQAAEAPGDSNPWARVSVVSVAYRSAGVIGDALASVARARAVVVVDNASDDDSAGVAQRALPKANIISNVTNQGFGRANNQGVAVVETEFALLLNPDARMAPGSVEALVAAADRNPNAGIVGPAILNADGARIASHNVGLFDQHKISGKERLPPDGDICADFLSGAVMLVRVAAFREVGGFDPEIFLYFEDDDLCLKMRRAGYALVQAPAAAAHHQGGLSSPPTDEILRRKYWHHAWSRLYLEAKHRNAEDARAWGRRNVRAYWFKASWHKLMGHKDKAWRDRARLDGTRAFLDGRSALAEAGINP